MSAEINKRISDEKNTTQKYADTVGENIYETCVVCRKMTDVPVDTPVEFRAHYEIGVGQLCSKCYKSLMEDK